MNYTNYFKDIKISNLLMTCNDCIKEVRKLKTYNFRNVESVCDSSAIRKLSSALKTHYEQLDHLITFLKGYLKVLQYAELIQKQQLKMKSTTDYSTKTAYAQKISSELKNMVYLIDNLQNDSSGLATFSSNNIYSTSQLQLDNSFKINYQKLKNLKSNFDSYGSALYNSYKNFYSMKSTVGKDSYLYYGWYRVLSAYQRVMKKRDSIDSWWTNYLSNILLLENQLPDNTTLSLKSASSKKYAGSTAYQSLNIKRPNLTEYAKKGVSGTFKTDMAIAKEVLAGKWGNGDARKKALAAAGYNYATIQSIVNSLVSPSGSGDGGGSTTAGPSRSFSSRSTSDYHATTTPNDTLTKKPTGSFLEDYNNLVNPPEKDLPDPRVVNTMRRTNTSAKNFDFDKASQELLGVKKNPYDGYLQEQLGMKSNVPEASDMLKSLANPTSKKN